jgi:hypothetical protein
MKKRINELLYYFIKYLMKLFIRALYIFLFAVWSVMLLTIIVPIIIYIVTGFNWLTDGIDTIDKLDTLM